MLCFIFLHCPLSGPVLIYISLLIISCIIEYVTNKRPLNLEPWTPCPRGLRQCWKIMVTTQNIDTLRPIWTFSLRGLLTFVASGVDINGCVLSYFEGTENVHCYTSKLTTLHCSKVSFCQCCQMKRYNKIFTKMWGVYSLLLDTVYIIGHKKMVRIVYSLFFVSFVTPSYSDTDPACTCQFEYEH